VIGIDQFDPDEVHQMSYMNINRPLYPRPGNSCGLWDCRDECDRRDCGDRESWRMPLFDCGGMDAAHSCGCGSQTIRLENPCCPGESAEVTLSVDNCGNLVIGVHKELWKCGCRHSRKRC